MKKFSALFLTVLMAFVFWGCSSTPDKSEVSAFGDAKVENMLQGYNREDYAMFSRDFGPMMKEAMTMELFDTLISENVRDVIGKYESKTLAKVTVQKHQGVSYIVAIYRAKFTQEDGDVAITIWFTDDEEKNIETILFSSPKLIEANG